MSFFYFVICRFYIVFFFFFCAHGYQNQFVFSASKISTLLFFTIFIEKKNSHPAYLILATIAFILLHFSYGFYRCVHFDRILKRVLQWKKIINKSHIRYKGRFSTQTFVLNASKSPMDCCLIAGRSQLLTFNPAVMLMDSFQLITKLYFIVAL